jgi:hypothetical protein
MFHFQQATDKTMKDIYDKMFDKNMPTTSLEGLKNLCWKRNYAFMATYGFERAVRTEINCSVMALEKASFTETLGMAFSKRSPYQQIINIQ